MTTSDERSTNHPPDAPPLRHEVQFAHEILMAEYKTLREEILKKMDHRTSMVVCSVTVSSAVLGFGIDRKSGSLLLVSPLVSLLLGMLILFHNVQIGEASEHLRKHYEDPIAFAHKDFTGWHHSKRDPRFRLRQRLLAYHLPLILIAIAPAVVAVPLAVANFSPPVLTIPILAVDAALLSIYIVLLAKYWREI